MSEPDTTRIQQETLEAIHDNAVDAIITINERGIIETVNLATEQQFGYAADELIGSNVSILMPSPYKQAHDGYLQNYRSSGVAKIIGIGREIPASRKDGTVFPAHLAVSEVRVDDRVVFAGFIRDLSELKRAERQEATLGRIIEDSLNEVYVFDAETLKFILVNRGGRENLGYSMEQFRDMTPFDIKPEFTEEMFRKKIQPLLADAGSTANEVNAARRSGQIEFNTIHQRRDKSTYDVDVHVQLSEFEGAKVFIAIILDVSRRREAERQMHEQQQAMQDELRRIVDQRTMELKEAEAELLRVEKLSTLGKVSGGIAHEIRNPLNAVKTSAYYLLHAKNPNSEKVREHLERIDRQVSMIDSVVTALSDVAKLPEANLVPLDMGMMLRELVRTVELPSNVRVLFDFEEDLPRVLVDEQQIAIAFRNLVRNARDAMPDGGTMGISGRKQDSRVVFCVSDSGMGIPHEHLDKILEPLFTTKARGIGLGLSITRAVVEKNRGELLVESKPGAGSRFCIVLNAEQS